MANLTKLNSSVIKVTDVSDALRTTDPLQTDLDNLEAAVDDLISNTEQTNLDASVSDLSTRSATASTDTDNIEQLANDNLLNPDLINSYYDSIRASVKTTDGILCYASDGVRHDLEMITSDEITVCSSEIDTAPVAWLQSNNRRLNTRHVKSESGPILNIMTNGSSTIAYTVNDGAQNQLVALDILTNTEFRLNIPNSVTASTMESTGVIYLGFANGTIKKFNASGALTNLSYSEIWSASFSMGEVTTLATSGPGGNLYAGGWNGIVNIINPVNNSVILTRTIHVSGNYIYKIMPLARFGISAFAVATRAKTTLTTHDNFHIISDSNTSLDSIYLNQPSGTNQIIDVVVLQQPAQLLPTSSGTVRFMATIISSTSYTERFSNVLFTFNGTSIATYAKNGSNNTPSYNIESFKNWYHDDSSQHYGGTDAVDDITSGGVHSMDNTRIIPMTTGEVFLLQIIDSGVCPAYIGQPFKSDTYTSFAGSGIGDIDVTSDCHELLSHRFKLGNIKSCVPLNGRIELGHHEE